MIDSCTIQILGQFNRGFIIARLERDLFIVDQVWLLTNAVFCVCVCGCASLFVLSARHG